MANQCMNCDKGILWGHRVSHAKNRTNRAFKPNLHKVRIMVAGHFHKMKLCTKCLRMVKRATSSVNEANASAISTTKETSEKIKI